MRKLLLLLGIVSMSSIAWSQEAGNITGKYYITNVDIRLKEYSLMKDTVTDNVYIAKKNLKFTTYETKDDNVLIKFWNFKNEVIHPQISEYEIILKSMKDVKDLYDRDGNKLKFDVFDSITELIKSESTKYISEETDGKYFLIDIKDFNQKVSEYYGKGYSFVWGFSIIPIKIRQKTSSSNFKFNTGFSLGVNAGVERSIASRKKQSIASVFGIGISTVEVEPFEVNNLISENSNEKAFTPSFGLIYTYENFQIGFFSGIDYLSGEMGSNWRYKNRPWFGFGLGFTIFQKNKTSGTESGN